MIGKQMGCHSGSNRLRPLAGRGGRPRIIRRHAPGKPLRTNRKCVGRYRGFWRNSPPADDRLSNSSHALFHRSPVPDRRTDKPGKLRTPPPLANRETTASWSKWRHNELRRQSGHSPEACCVQYGQARQTSPAIYATDALAPGGFSPFVKPE